MSTMSCPSFPLKNDLEKQLFSVALSIHQRERAWGTPATRRLARPTLGRGRPADRFQPRYPAPREWDSRRETEGETWGDVGRREGSLPPGPSAWGGRGGHSSAFWCGHARGHGHKKGGNSLELRECSHGCSGTNARIDKNAECGCSVLARSRFWLQLSTTTTATATTRRKIRSNSQNPPAAICFPHSGGRCSTTRPPQ